MQFEYLLRTCTQVTSRTHSFYSSSFLFPLSLFPFRSRCIFSLSLYLSFSLSLSPSHSLSLSLSLSSSPFFSFIFFPFLSFWSFPFSLETPSLLRTKLWLHTGHSAEVRISHAFRSRRWKVSLDES